MAGGGYMQGFDNYKYEPLGINPADAKGRKLKTEVVVKINICYKQEKY